jgi:uncharacterized protein YdeI (YjbR/CyaY-like superfamily)
MKTKFFRTPVDFRKWLEKNHVTAAELWVGYYRKDSGKPSMTWPESVDEALRFSPRRRGSIWSAINIRRAQQLTRQKRMRPAGSKAFAARIENRSGIYSYEQRPVEVPAAYARLIKKNKAAWNFFQAQPPSYRKMITWCIVSAKKEETRSQRLKELMEASAKRKRL